MKRNTAIENPYSAYLSKAARFLLVLILGVLRRTGGFHHNNRQQELDETCIPIAGFHSVLFSISELKRGVANSRCSRYIFTIHSIYSK